MTNPLERVAKVIAEKESTDWSGRGEELAAAVIEALRVPEKTWREETQSLTNSKDIAIAAVRVEGYNQALRDVFGTTIEEERDV